MIYINYILDIYNYILDISYFIRYFIYKLYIRYFKKAKT